MTEFLLAIALLAILFFMWTGIKSGGFHALRWMLGSLLALFVALRYWFLASQSASTLQPLPLPVLAAFCFWLLFIVVLYGFMKGCDDYIEAFDSETPSIMDRLLGAVFGGVTGAVFVSSVAMTVCLLAPQCFPERPELLPVPIGKMPIAAYRYVETKLAGISETDPAHTPLPQFQNSPQNPVFFK